MLAGDTANDWDDSLIGPQMPSGFLSTQQSEGELAMVDGEAPQSFAQSLRASVDEISRVIQAISSAPEMGLEIPYLGALSPVSTGNAASVDTATIGSLMDLSGRFESEVAAPLRAHLDANPLATTGQLISQFDFLQSVPGQPGGVSGVRLNLELGQRIDSTIAALLDPITAGSGGLIEAVDADALATDLPVDFAASGLSFDVLEDAEQRIGISVPSWSWGASEDLISDFAANVGFLAGQVSGGKIDIDFGFDFDFGNLFHSDLFGGTSLAGLVPLELIGELSIADISDALRMQFVGDGLDVRLPFDFALAGFETGGFLPTFYLSDQNPFDGVFPQFDLAVSPGAPYSADALLGFHSLDANSMLVALEQLGEVFGGWESGDLLNFPIPLADNVTVGDVVGFADGYASAVMQFLRSDEGLPTFKSVQELAELIPAINNLGPIESLSYDAETRTINLSLEFLRSPDPIIAQANIDLIAGRENSPVAQVSMTPGVLGQDNRLAITRNASLGFALQISLGERPVVPADVVRDRLDAAEGDLQGASGWTPMTTILERMGLLHLANMPQTLEVLLQDGTTAVVDMGIVDEFTSLEEWLERGTVVANGNVVMELQYEPPSIARMPYESTRDRIFIRDYTSTDDRIQVVFDYSGETDGQGFKDDTPIDDPDVPTAATLGEARRYVMEQIGEHLSSVFAASYPGETWTVLAQFAPPVPDPEKRGLIASAITTENVLGQDISGGVADTVYVKSLANHIQGLSAAGGNPLNPGPVLTATFRSNVDFDFDVTGPSELGQHGLFKIALHEMIHGLGFSKNFNKDGLYYVPGYPSIFDEFLQLADGTPVTSLTSSAGRAAALISDSLFFAGPQAAANNPLNSTALPNQLPKIFAPTTYNGGSSGSHFDTDTFSRFGETMTHAVSSYLVAPIGVSPMTAGALYDLGYTATTVGVTSLLSNDDFWTTFFTDTNSNYGAIGSRPVNEAAGLLDPATALFHFFPLDVDGILDENHPLVVTFSDGTTEVIDYAPTFSLNVGDLLSQLNISDGGQTRLSAEIVGDAIVLTDETTPIPGGEFSIDWANPNRTGLISKFVRPADAIPGTNKIILRDVVAALPFDKSTAVDHTTTLATLFGETNTDISYGIESTASLQMQNGAIRPISTEVLTPETTIGDIIDSLSIQDGDEWVTRASLSGQDDRILLEDRTAPNGNSLFQIVDTTGGGGIYDVLFRRHLMNGKPHNANRDALIYSDSLDNLESSELADPDIPLVLVEQHQSVPEWTPLETVMRRAGIVDDVYNDQSIKLRLRNGSTPTLLIDGPVIRHTVSDATDSLKTFVGDQVTAEIVFRDGRWVLLDHTTGTLETIISDTNGRLFEWLFASPEKLDDGNLASRLLGESILEAKSGDARMALYADGRDDAMFTRQQAAPIEVTLRDGSVHRIELGNVSDATVLDVLNQFTIRRDGELILRAWVEDEAFHFEDLSIRSPDQSVTGEFSIRWADGGEGGQWPARFIAFESDLDRDGRIDSEPFMQAIPTNTAPTSRDTPLNTILARKLILQEIGKTNTATVHLRNGAEYPLETGVIEESDSLGSLADRLTIKDGDTPLLLVTVQDDRLVFTDMTTQAGQNEFQIVRMTSSEGRLFLRLGVTSDNATNTRTASGPNDPIRSASLSTHHLTPDSSFGEVFGELNPALNGADAEWNFRVPVVPPLGGSATQYRFVNVGPFTKDSLLSELLDQLKVKTLNGFTRNAVSAVLIDGRIVIRNGAQRSEQINLFEINDPEQNIVDVGTLPQYSDLFFDGRLDYDDDGTLVGRALVPSLTPSVITQSTTLQQYFGKKSYDAFVANGVTTPMVADLRDGTQVSFVIENFGQLSLSEFAEQFTIVRDEQLVLEAQLVRVEQSGRQPILRYVLVDRTEPAGGETPFSVRIPQGTTEPHSMLPIFLGLGGVDQVGSGVIVGPSLTEVETQLAERIRITEAPTLHAEIGVAAENVNASVRVGELLGANLENGFGAAALTVDLALLPPAGQDYLSLKDLLDALANPSEQLAIRVDADVEFSAEVSVDLAGLNIQSDNPNEIPRIILDWPDAITNDPNLRLQTDTFSITTENFDNLFKFDKLTVQHITELVRKLVDLIERMSSDRALERNIPLLNASLGQVLGSVEHVTRIVDQITTNPDATLQTLEQDLENTLGLEPDELTLSYDEALSAIRVDFDLNEGLENPVATTFGLIDFNLGGGNLTGTDGFDLVDFGGGGSVSLDADATLSLHVGLKLDELLPTAEASIDNALIIYDTTGLVADARALADDLSFTATVVNLGVDVGPGTIVLDRDGAGSSQDPARITLDLTTAPNGLGYYTLDAIDPIDFDYAFDAAAGVTLPMSFAGLPTQDLLVGWEDLTSFDFDVLPAGSSLTGGNQIVLPDLQAAIDDFDLADGIYALAVGLQGLFDLIDDYLGDEILGVPIPFIGDALDDMVNFVDNFRGRLTDGLSQQGLAAEAAQFVIFDALGPASGLNGGAGLLDDLNGDGSITVDDVGITFGSAAAPLADGGEGEGTFDEVMYRLRIAQDLVGAEGMIDLDVGVPGLGLDIEGDVAASFGYSFEVGFGISESAGVFVEFFDGDEIALNFEASIDDLMGEGRIGPLTITAETLDASDLSDESRMASRLDPNDASSETINAVAGAYQIDLGLGRYSLGELGSIASLGISTQASLVGSLHLGVETMVGHADLGLPSVVADLHVQWDRVSGTIAEALTSLATPEVSLTDVNLDLGAFISDVIGPVLEPINKFLDPLRPVLNAITTPIPVLSDIAGETTFVDLIGLFGDGGRSVANFVEAAADIIRLIDLPVIDGRILLPLGNFGTSLNGDGTLDPIAQDGAFGGSGDFDSFVDGLTQPGVRDYLQSLPKVDSEVGIEPGKFSVPLLTDPLSAVGYLFGKEVDLIKYRAPRLEATFSYSQYIPIWPIFGITVGGSFSTVVDFAFGYDTAGIRKFVETQRPIDLLDGFYLDDQLRYNDDGDVIDDIAELQFRLGLLAGGEINLVAVQAGVQGGFYAGIDLNLNDPDLDGKIRLGELNENLAYGIHPLLGPIWIFDASGKLEVGVDIYAKALGFKGELSLGPFTVLDFDIPRPVPAMPELGHVEPDGRLVVHVGPNAPLRVEGDLSDGADEIIVAIDDDTQDVIVSGFGRNQVFENVSRIFIDSGEAADKIIIDEDLLLPIRILAGDGNDEIQAGGGPAFIDGGEGNDLLVGSFADDTIFGGAGEDVIDGGEGHDSLRGGSGMDQIRGGAGNDRVHGDGDNDSLTLGEGSDYGFGGDGDDTLSGDAGDDVLHGESEDGSGSGEDFIQGGSGHDVLIGGPMPDQLFGGTGGDDLYGGDGNDLLVAGSAVRGNPLFSELQSSPDTGTHFMDGGEGDDLIYGTAGIDTVEDRIGHNIIRTYEANDVVTTGDGDDRIFTGIGDDVVSAGDGINLIRTGAGFDIVSAGIGNDVIDLRPLQGIESMGGEVIDAGGDNRIYTDDGDDLIQADGNNFISAGDGENTITTFNGNDIIRTGSGTDIVDAGGGNNDVSTSGGDDRVRTGGGIDHISTGGGNDWIDAGSDDDVIASGGGDDFVIAGRGSDAVYSGQGNDIVWAGLAFFDEPSLRGSLAVPTEFDTFGAYSGFVSPSVLPTILGDLSVPGTIDDGNDTVFSGAGDDIVFGGGGDDDLYSEDGNDFVDGGVGADRIESGRGVDYVRGGDGADTLRGGDGIDLIRGGPGNDDLYGDAGDGQEQFGQILFGELGDDTLYAYAPTDDDAVESQRIGDRLDGGPGRDTLLGNLRREVMWGGSGDDTLSGDRLAGPNYGINNATDLSALITGGADTMFGGSGDDVLRGGGGDDEMWGGSDTDVLEGHAGRDTIRGGTGIDFIYLDINPAYPTGSAGGDFDGFFGNSPDSNVSDDGATDILVIEGTPANDVITLGGNPLGQLTVFYDSSTFAAPIQERIDFRDAEGRATIQQFQVDGLGGDDRLEFDSSLDLGEFAERSRDWVGVFNGGSGNDTLIGSQGRDWLSGGPGSDRMFGYGGDDRMWGDDQDGRTTDNDILFAGTGNDDLFGGIGSSQLYAWSSDPRVGGDFGVYVDTVTGQRFDTAGPNRVLEDTGLNRMLGRDGDDFLFAGTGLDFMYGGGGDNRLFDVNGVAIEFGIGVPSSEEWLEYARSTDKIWYYGGSGADDVITVDYVTEPGVLGDHHLITRLTENNGLFTFDAQVQLDFGATDESGNLIWDAHDLVYRIEELSAQEQASDETGDDARRLTQRDIELSGSVLPPEGDYLAIVIDAKAGDDEIRVGPTVQRSVWIAAGDGDDTVLMESGVPLLVDLADADNRNELAGNSDSDFRAFDLNSLVSDDPLAEIADTTLFSNLSLDSPTDVDWYHFTVPVPQTIATISVDSVAQADEIELQIWQQNPEDELALLASGLPAGQSQPRDPNKPARVAITLAGTAMLQAGVTYSIRVRSLSNIPTLYDLGLDFKDGRPLGDITFDLGVATDVYLRRDVIVGGDGHDVLQGGPSEDWVIGGPGNDVLSGGHDGGASDILIGESGDDLLQVYLADLPTDSAGGQLRLTLADQLDGGDGYDRVLIQGGDVDRFGNPINDHLTLSYNIPLGTMTLAGLVWDTGNKEFIKDGGKFVVQEVQYQTQRVEGTLVDLRGGDDELRLEDGYQFPDADPENDPTYGISPGHRQAGASSLSFEIRGGAGNDRLFGSPYNDVIDAGSGIDFVAGLGGDDSIFGGSDADLLLGDGGSVIPIDVLEAQTVNGFAVTNDSALHATELDLSGGSVNGLSFHQGDRIDWYVLPLPISGGPLTPANLPVTFDSDPVFGGVAQNAFNASWIEPLVTVTPAIFDSTSGGYLPTFTAANADVYLLGIENPRSRAIIASGANRFGELAGSTGLSLGIDLDNQSAKDFGFTVDSSTSGAAAAQLLNDQFVSQGIDGDVFAEFDPIENRLMLVMRRAGTMRLLGNAASWATLGFELDQIVGEQPTALGSYSIQTQGVTFSPKLGPQNEVSPYRMEIGRVDVNFAASAKAPSLAQSESPTLFGAMRIEGSADFESIGFTSVVGDFNGDGFDDLFAGGIETGYVVLGPITPTADALSILDTAQIVIDLRGDDSTNWVPVDGGADLDDDGRIDMAFYRFSELTDSLNVAVLTGQQIVSGETSVEQDAPLVFTTSVSDVLGFGDVDVQFLEYDATIGADLMVFARQPVIDRAGKASHGGVFGGAEIAALLASPGVPLGVFNSIAWVENGGESDAVVNDSVGTKYTPMSGLPLNFRQELQATKIDSDGDGQDEIALTRPHGWVFQNTNEPTSYLVVGRTYLLDAGGGAIVTTTGGSGAPAVVQSNSFNTIGGTFNVAGLQFAAVNRKRAALSADFDFDGQDELVLLSDGDGEDVLIYSNLVADGNLRTSGDASLRLGNVAPDMGQLRSVGVGDFDDDLDLDLVVSTGNAPSLISGVRVIYDPMQSETAYVDLNNSQLDTELFLSVEPGDLMGFVTTVAGDFTGDGIDDLSIGAPRFDAVSGGVEINAGAVFLLAGQKRLGIIQDANKAIILENMSIRGIGGVLVDDERLLRFDGETTGQSGDFTLQNGDSTKLFTFRTIGDGQLGDMLRLGPSISNTPFLVNEGVTGYVGPSDRYATSIVDPILVGGAIDNLGLFQFDLGKLLPALADPEALLGAEIKLTAHTTGPTTIKVDFVQSDGFEFLQHDLNSASSLFGTDEFTVKDGETFTIDVADAAGGLTRLQDLMRNGVRHLVARFYLVGGAPEVQIDRPDSTLPEPTGLLLYQRPGVIGSLMDAQGRVLQADSAGFDLRNIDAGTYYLQVRSASPETQGGTLPFDIVVDAPAMGGFDRLSDNDSMFGGDGDDILVGGPGLDSIWGNSGSDAFTAEMFEPLDRQAIERLREPIGDDILDFDDSSFMTDPLVVIDPDVDELAPRGVIEIAAPELAEAIGRAVGVNVTTRADGTPTFARPLRASELGGVTYLDLSNSFLRDLSGIELLTGLAALDLSQSRIGNDELARLLPAEGGALGINALQYLNLDFNGFESTSVIAMMRRLEVLSMAFNYIGEGEVIDGPDLVELSELEQLSYLDVSGTFLTSLNGLAGTYGIDDLELRIGSFQPAADWKLVASETSASVGETYHVLDAINHPISSSTWLFGNLPAGEYEVFASWHADEAHASQVQYRVDGDPINVNQRSSPASANIGGVAFERLSNLSISQNRSVSVTVQPISADGLVIADAILIRPIENPMPILEAVHAANNRLESISFDVLADSVGETTGAEVWTGFEPKPVWSGLPRWVVTDALVGKVIRIDDINSYAQLPTGEFPSVQAYSLNPNIKLRRRSGGLEISQVVPQIETADVILMARTDAGQTATTALKVGFGGSVVDGTIANQFNGQGFAGATLIFDLNRNQKHDAGEPITTSDIDGNYSLFVPRDQASGSQENVLVPVQTDWLATDPTDPILVDIPGFPNVLLGNDLTVAYAVAFDIPSLAAEGQTITTTATGPVPFDSIEWFVDNVSTGTSQPFFSYSFGDGGIHTVTANVTIAGVDYSTRRTVRALDVAPVVNAGGDVVIPEGQFTFNREVIVDPGNDIWDVSVDFGDGSEPSIIKSTSSRTVDLKHVYTGLGFYDVVITVFNSEGFSSDRFMVNVQEAEVALELTPENSTNVKGQAAEFLAEIFDPSFQIDQYTWSYQIEWGDGTPAQLINEQVVIPPLATNYGSAELSHVYAAEGTYEVELLVVDDDGSKSLKIIQVVIGNDKPLIQATVPATADEKTVVSFSADVTDLDGVASVLWDFGDGLPTQLGSSVEHVFANPGTYQVVVTATDATGLINSVTHEISVANVNEAPKLRAVSAIAIQETVPWEYQVDVDDLDILTAGDSITYTLVGQPAGVTINASGLIRWTPTVDQGPNQYHFDVVAIDDSGLSSSRTLWIRVIDSGSIEGVLFKDISGDGRRGDDEPLLAGLKVGLDHGNDGTFDQIAITDQNGRYEFNSLPRGLYRIEPFFVSSWQLTTPSQIIFDMSVSDSLIAADLGGSDDTDHDGVSNEDEMNATAGVDGNSDGIPDWQQGNVVSVDTIGGPVTIFSAAGTVLSGVRTLQSQVHPTDPIQFPFGRIDFDVTGLVGGGRASVELIYGQNPSINAVFQIDSSDPGDIVFRQWGQAGDGSVSLLGDRVQLQLRDASAADLDATAGSVGHSIQLAATDQGADLRRYELGRVNDGVAVSDDAVGTGYLLFSIQNVHTRFANAAIPLDNSDHVVAVRFINGEWQMNNNKRWIPFAPNHSDRLLAQVDFDQDTIQGLQGMVGEIDGIEGGYQTSDLTFLADRWNGSSNDGEFTVSGTYFEAFALPPPAKQFLIGSVNRGVAVSDDAQGTGYIMFTTESVRLRFSDNPVHLFNSEHLVAVRFAGGQVSGGQWQYNNNQQWYDFQPRANDRLIASVDFDADTMVGLWGQQDQIGGIELGYSSGDLTFLANRWNGVVNSGEFAIEGTFFDVEPSVVMQQKNLGAVNAGIRVSPDASGQGYILFSEQDIHSRFADGTPSVGNSDHLIAVQFIEGQWFYNNGNQWVPLTPLVSDRLVAQVDFETNSIVGLQNRSGVVNGIQRGYSDGNLDFFANRWDGADVQGSFTIDGTVFTTHSSPPTLRTVKLGSVRSGIAVAEDAVGTGYILFSEANVHERFSGLPAENSDRLVAVRFSNGRWQFNDDQEWIDFTPVASDRLVAEVDFESDSILPLQGASGTTHGIELGYYDGDLVMFANRWAGVGDDGEFTIEGTYMDLVSDGVPANLNLDQRYDSNSDGRVTASDALRVINEISGAVSEPEFASPLLLDVNLDGRVSALDALNVINYLAFLQSSESTAGEAEAVFETDAAIPGLQAFRKATAEAIAPIRRSDFSIQFGLRADTVDAILADDRARQEFADSRDVPGL